MDRNLLHDDLVDIGKRNQFNKRDRQTLRLLKNCPIYELTNVVALFEKKPPDNQIPKRPPHRIMWAEWKWHDETPLVAAECGFIDWTIGALLIGDGDNLWTFKNPVNWRDGADAVFKNREQSCAIEIFSRVDKTGGKLSTGRSRIATCGFPMIACYQDGFRSITHLTMVSAKPSQREIESYVTFGLPIHIPHGYDSNPLNSPWPMHFCFSLLACKNVTTESVAPTSRQQREILRQNKRVPSRYRIIKLTKPIRVASNDGDLDSTDEAGSKQRFHLVRGHFKDLQHDRYKVKGLHWWPEHWRGDEKLGTIQRVAVLQP